VPEPDGPVEDMAIPLLGGRRFWVYRGHLGLGDPAQMIREPFDKLEAEFDPDGEDPIGLCVLLTGEQIKRRPEAEWDDPRMFYVGYVDGRAQVRIAYFEGARIGPPAGESKGSLPAGYEVRQGYRVEVFADQDEISEQDIIDFWASESALNPAAAAERVREVLLIAVTDDGELAGVSSAKLRQNEQLWMDMWHFRVFVSGAHRTSQAGIALALGGREHLKQRFVSGEDTRAAGIVYVVQNEGLKRVFDDAVWRTLDFAFIGENPRGDHLRVHYFPGATAPGPPGPREPTA
jgi:hypothetical protein